MKTRLLPALLIGAFTMTFPARLAAAPEDSGMAMITDVVIARPLCLAATAIGSVFFVVSLPVAAITKDVGRTADALVVTPAKATFTRRLGDFEELKDY
ncbi:MAG TPA: hypothetical protein VFC26_05110 [Verrucomicrobiae bacterium]|nr:hypothetical protein [Verrucomicrobiae bacterium]